MIQQWQQRSARHPDVHALKACLTGHQQRIWKSFCLLTLKEKTIRKSSWLHILRILTLLDIALYRVVISHLCRFSQDLLFFAISSYANKHILTPVQNFFLKLRALISFISSCVQWTTIIFFLWLHFFWRDAHINNDFVIPLLYKEN